MNESRFTNPTINFPQTAADFMQIELWIAEGFSNQEIFEKMRDPSWRSEVTHLLNHLFCLRCDQIISVDHCSECGQALPPHKLILFEHEMAALRTRKKKKPVGSEL